jgi:hypothetical protein
MSIAHRCNTNDLIHRQQSMNVDHVLQDVPDDMKVVALDICNTIQALRPFKFIMKLSTLITKSGFEIVATLSTPDEVVSVQDLQTLMDINPTRIAFTCVKLIDHVMCIVVRVTSTVHPLMLTDVQITHIRKKQRWFSD